MPPRGEPVEQRLVQRPAATGPPAAGREVDADRRRPPVGGPRHERPAVGIADDVAVVLEHQPGVRALRLGDPPRPSPRPTGGSVSKEIAVSRTYGA